jgi:hypothetical protein
MTPERAALILSASLVTDRWRSTAVVLNGQQYELFLSNEFAAVVAAEWTSDSIPGARRFRKRPRRRIG